MPVFVGWDRAILVPEPLFAIHALDMGPACMGNNDHVVGRITAPDQFISERRTCKVLHAAGLAAGRRHHHAVAGLAVWLQRGVKELFEVKVVQIAPYPT